MHPASTPSTTPRSYHALCFTLPSWLANNPSPYLPSALSPPDTFIQKTKKLYLDTRTQRNLSKLNDDLAEVHSIMTRNIQEVLGQGEKLDSEWGQGQGREW